MEEARRPELDIAHCSLIARLATGCDKDGSVTVDHLTPEQLRTALEVVSAVLADVDDEEWGLLTPCDDWDVRELVNHVVAGNLLFAGVLDDRGSMMDLRMSLLGDQLGSDPVGAFAAAGDGLVNAFRQLDSWEKGVQFPFGEVSSRDVLHLRTTEVLVHGWDLAQALGRDVWFDDGVVEREIIFNRSFLPRIPSERRAFAPPRLVADDEPPLQRLVALLGRQA